MSGGGSPTAADWQHIDVSSIVIFTAGFCDENMSAVSDLVKDVDDVLFQRAMRDKHHILLHLFPDHKTEFSMI